ncbi:MAG TPA: hypothetical protein VFB92_15465 [Vicinamibacterales bacterium]|nr:hypothetical protein [Vicinamibacterales bacterium]
MITVIPGHRGRHLFEGIRDPRIRAFEALTDSSPNLIVFPCGQDRRFDRSRTIRIPDDIQRGISQGRIGLVFDASTEGVMHKPDISDALHMTLDHLRGVPEQCVYVTQDRNYRSDYATHCTRTGRARQVHVLNHDYWIWDALSHFADTGDDEYRRRLQTFRARPAQRARKFVSLNRTPRPMKVLFLLRVISDGLWNSGFISFGGFRSTADGPGKAQPSEEEMVRALPGFEDLIHSVMPEMKTLAGVGRSLLGMEQHGWDRLELWNASRAVDLEEYANSWFTAVTETEMRSRPSRITEKLIKPLANFQPFVVFANPGALRMVRDYGFFTFENIVDESYDDEPDPRRRFDLAYAEFARLCAQSEQEWSRMEKEIEDRLTFNAHWGLTRLPTEVRRRQDCSLVDEIVRAVGLTNLTTHIRTQ